MKLTFTSLLLLLVFTTSGCMSMGARNFGDERTFPGVRGHIAVLRGPVSEDTWWLFDFPFSLLFDVVAFPYDLAK
jgi:uncharacterized protein YceK